MRRISLTVPRGRGADARAIAANHGGRDIVSIAAHAPDADVDVVVAHVPNRAVGAIARDVEGIEDARMSFAPHDVLALEPASRDRAPEELADVGAKSTTEVVLAGIQSIGSWRSFLAYAAVSAVVAWIGLVTDTIFLLTASMLIAPFASPAMNAALASARGASELLGRSLARYVASILVAALVAGALTWLFRVRSATPLMSAIASLSRTSVLLPAVAGIAGALHLMQSERKSLISGAATGMLVAAAIAPPAALCGMGVVLGRADLVSRGAFQILLQIFAINLAGAVVFRAYGVRACGERYANGRRWLVPVTLGGSAAAVVALVTWQLTRAAPFDARTVSAHARAAIADEVAREGGLDLVDARIEFPRSDTGDEAKLLCVVFVERLCASGRADEQVRNDLARALGRRLERDEPGVVPLVDVHVFTGSSSW